MNSIWRKDGAEWRLLAPTDYPDEATLHSRVAEAPQMLPLAGSPDLVIVGKEVRLGAGIADLIAVESSGRLVVIEVKLKKNGESQRSVVAQVLTYAAYLRGMDIATLEKVVLERHLRERGYANLASAVNSDDQDSSFNPADFEQGVAESLRDGRFRLVLVLDEAPEELVRLVGYLEAVTDGLLIDLIVISAYDVQGSQILVPQRIQPEEQRVAVVVSTLPSSLLSARPNPVKGTQTPGAEIFVESISKAAEKDQPELRRLYAWALSLEKRGLTRLITTVGVGRWILRLFVPGDDGSLAAIYNEKGASISLYRSKFERRAPQSLLRVEEVIAPVKVGQGTSTDNTSEELLAALTAAYQEAVSGKVTAPEGDSTDV